MTTTRANPNTGQLEVRHPDLNIWVQAVASLLIEGGTDVALTPAQLAILTAIRDDADTLPALLTAVSNNTSAVTTMSGLVDNIRGPQLASVLASLTNILGAIPTKAELTDVRNSLTGGTSINALLTAINTTRFSDVNTRLDALSTAISSLQSELLKGVATTSAAIVNVTLTLANTEYVYTVPQGTKRIAFKCRGDVGRNDPMSDIRYSWVAGKVAGGAGGAGTDSYDILPFGAEEDADMFIAADRALYFASPVAGVILSVRRWA